MLKVSMATSKKIYMTQSGHSITTVMLAIVLLGLIGFSYIKINKNSAKSVSTTTSSTASSTPATSDTYVEPKDDEYSILGENNLVTCKSQEFTMTIPKGWYAYSLSAPFEGFEGDCMVSNLKRSQLPAVGPAVSNDIDLYFENDTGKHSSVSTWVEDYIKYLQDNEYPYTYLGQEELILNNNETAMLIFAKGGHYQENVTFFLYKKGTNEIRTSWTTESKLADAAIQALKTIQ